MLKCWDIDFEKRPCFKDIVVELSEEVGKGYVIEFLN